MFLGITFPFFGGLLSFFGGLAFAPTTYFVSFSKDPCMIALIDPFFFLQQQQWRILNFASSSEMYSRADQTLHVSSSFPASCGSRFTSPNGSAFHGSSTG
jgi:hypothetical protein